MIVDTDVLIWYMRGDQRAKKVLSSIGKYTISAITYMELVQGMRDKKELMALKDFLKNFGIKIITVDEMITNRAIFYMEEYFLSHNLRMADALIGSTASVIGEPILTGNQRHYKMLKDVKIERFNR